MSETPEVLFVCVHNAGRSQMAAGLLKLRSDGRIHVRSAGSAPGEEINPAVVEAMEELGVDMSEEFPKPLTDEFVQAADVVITMGCGDACPIYPGKTLRGLGARRSGRAGRRDGARRSATRSTSASQRLIAELLPDERVSVDDLLRALVAEAIGTFALVFAGCGAIMVDAKTHALGHVGVAITFGLVIMS